LARRIRNLIPLRDRITFIEGDALAYLEDHLDDSNSRRSLEKRIRPYSRLVLTARRPSRTGLHDDFFIISHTECLLRTGIRCDQGAVAPKRHDVGSRIMGRHLGQAMI